MINTKLPFKATALALCAVLLLALFGALPTQAFAQDAQGAPLSSSTDVGSPTDMPTVGATAIVLVVGVARTIPITLGNAASVSVDSNETAVAITSNSSSIITITPNSQGATTITVTFRATDNTPVATHTIKVIVVPAGSAFPSVAASSLTLTVGDNPTSVTIGLGSTTRAEINSDALAVASVSVATIASDGTGTGTFTVTPEAEGAAIIHVKFYNGSDMLDDTHTIAVTVLPADTLPPWVDITRITLTMGGASRPVDVNMGSAATAQITSDNTDVATVSPTQLTADDDSFTVTPIAAGKATITVTFFNGSATEIYTWTIAVTVLPAGSILPTVSTHALGFALGDSPKSIAISLGNVAKRASISIPNADAAVAAVSSTTLTQDGSFTITPTGVGTTAISIFFYDAADVQVGAPFYITVSVAPTGTRLPTVNPSALNFTLGGAPQSVSFTLGTNVDDSPYATDVLCTYTSGVYTLSGTPSDGHLLVTPTNVGTSQFSLHFRDAAGNILFTITIPVTVTAMGGNAGDTGAGGIGGGTGITPPAPTLTQEMALASLDAALAALPAGQNKLVLTLTGYSSVSNETLAAMAESAQRAGISLTLHFDTIQDGGVALRMIVDPVLYTKAIAAQAAAGNPTAAGLSLQPHIAPLAITTTAFLNNHFSNNPLAVLDFGNLPPNAGVTALVRMPTTATAMQHYVQDPATDIFHRQSVPATRDGYVIVYPISGVSVFSSGELTPRPSYEIWDDPLTIGPALSKESIEVLILGNTDPDVIGPLASKSQ